MKSKTKNIILLIVGIIFLLVTRTMFKEHNLKKQFPHVLWHKNKLLNHLILKKLKKFVKKEFKNKINLI